MGRFFGLIEESAKRFIRHLAWLDAKPTGYKVTRRQQYKGSPFLDLQPEQYCAWVVNHALECGLYTSNGYGAMPISWAEIKAYLGVTLNNWVWLARLLKALSIEYVSEHHKAENPARFSPYQEDLDVENNRAAVRQQLKNFIKAKARR